MIFFLIAYFVIGAMMLTVGAVVNDMREAQSMMMPIMLLIMTPWIFWLPISREPNSTFSTVDQLRPAGQHVHDAAADDVEHAAALVAGVDCRSRSAIASVVGGAVVRGEGVPDRPADVRQAAGLRHDDPLGTRGLTRRT